MVPREAWIAVYMMADRYRGTLYAGVTAQFITRITDHREGRGSGFTRRYGLTRLVWYEEHMLMTEAIQRETSIKRWPRQWKINLIERDNPRWDDLYAAVFEWTPVPKWTPNSPPTSPAAPGTAPAAPGRAARGRPTGRGPDRR